jgi:hypothetical protein
MSCPLLVRRLAEFKRWQLLAATAFGKRGIVELLVSVSCRAQGDFQKLYC